MAGGQGGQEDTLTVHASCVALGRACVLIRGPSGSGKSALALQLMAYGCMLVADDRVRVMRRDGVLLAERPETLPPAIEMRGLGLLAAGTARHPALVALCVDLGETETERLPPIRHTEMLGCSIPLVHKVENAHFPAAILQYLKGGRYG